MKPKPVTPNTPRPHVITLGRIVATRGALAEFSHTELIRALTRHAHGDWGTLCDEDKRSNNAAVRHGARVLSAYEIHGARLWVITEADRSVTTCLLPDEY